MTPALAFDPVKIGIVSISDRASSGVYVDKGLPALQDWLTRALHNPLHFEARLIPDEQATISADDAWNLSGVVRTEFPARDQQSAQIQLLRLERFRWPNQISAQMVSAALLKPERMSTIDLFQYIQHLEANQQSAQRYEIEFWRKVFYPLSCLVMVVLALPFAYLHFRSGGISAYVFGGVMAGISFFLLNNLFGHMGNLQNWQPWLSAALPGLIYSALSLAAFGWLVFRR